MDVAASFQKKLINWYNELLYCKNTWLCTASLLISKTTVLSKTTVHKADIQTKR